MRYLKSHALLPVLAAGLLALAGCANTSPYSGDVYTGNQAKTAQSVSYGTITALRQVRFRAATRTAVPSAASAAPSSVVCWVTRSAAAQAGR